MKHPGLVLLVALLCVAAARKPQGPLPPTTFDVETIDAYVREQVKDSGMAGLSLAIMREGKIVLAKGYGVSSLEDKKPVTADTLFAIGSVTKQFACACILLLAEDGKLSVEDKVAKYFPGLTRANDITLLDLMNHVSGYPDYYPLDFLDRRMMKPIGVDALILEYAGGKLDFEPGTRWSYSNTGYIILGRVVEKVTGNSFASFLEARILKPLGLEHTRFDPEPSTPGLAQGYTSYAFGPLEKATPEAKGWIYSAGAIYSTPLDLAKWDLALMEGSVLKLESYKIMTTARALTTGKAATYGCGLSVGLRDGWTLLSHSGAVNGFVTRNAMIPGRKAAIAMVSNTDTGSAFGKIYNSLVSLLTQSETNVPKISGVSAADAAKDIFSRLQSGKVDRERLGEEFNFFLSEQKAESATKRLKPYGTPKAVLVEDLRERGGMEVSTLRLTFGTGTLKALMYRTPDGKIQQFFVDKD